MDNPTDPKEVELREVDKKTPLEKNNNEPQQLIVDELPSIPLKEIAQKVVEKINCRKHFGIYGLLIMLFLLLISCGQFTPFPLQI